RPPHGPGGDPGRLRAAHAQGALDPARHHGRHPRGLRDGPEGRRHPGRRRRRRRAGRPAGRGAGRVDHGGHGAAGAGPGRDGGPGAARAHVAGGGGRRRHGHSHPARDLPRGGERPRPRAGRPGRRLHGGGGGYVSRWDAVRKVTGWEFRRFLRLRELITTVFVVAALGAGVPLAIDFLTSRGEGGTVTLAVPVGAGMEDVGRFAFVEMDSAAADRALAEGDVDGILEPTSAESPTLVVEREPGWTGELSEALSQVALAGRLEASRLSPAEFEALVRPVDLEVEARGASTSSGS